jgi:hypothetical protein
MGQGSAKPADDAALALDETGFTNPNLHQRIDPQGDASYGTGIYNLNLYRTKTLSTHDEESTTCEIP